VQDDQTEQQNRLLEKLAEAWLLVLEMLVEGEEETGKLPSQENRDAGG
jgi:hypothetical protein